MMAALPAIEQLQQSEICVKQNSPWRPPSYHKCCTHLASTTPLSVQLTLLQLTKQAVPAGNMVRHDLDPRPRARAQALSQQYENASNKSNVPSVPVPAASVVSKKRVRDLGDSTEGAMDMNDDDNTPQSVEARPRPDRRMRAPSLQNSTPLPQLAPRRHTYYENEIRRKEDEYRRCRKELEHAREEIVAKDGRIRELEHALHEAGLWTDAVTYNAGRKRPRLQGRAATVENDLEILDGVVKREE